MSAPKATPTWSASPAAGTMLARLIELYARALRVDVALKAQRRARLIGLLERRNRR